MPVLVKDGLPALKELEQEHLFLMNHQTAIHQDIRPLRIAILNLMPDKRTTEKQLLRLISNSLIQIEVTFLHLKSHSSKNTDSNHLETYYQTFDEVRDQNWDGVIVTGAPVEHLAFEEVDYWNELTEILDHIEAHVNSALFICWGAQAALKHYYGIGKHALEDKVFGIFDHRVTNRDNPISRGFDDVFKAPHSRYTYNSRKEIISSDRLEIVAESTEGGVFLWTSKDLGKVFVTGHPEYDADTLHNEYVRDLEKGVRIKMPSGYYPDDKTYQTPLNTWRGHANLLYSNWINYCVYQSHRFG